MAPAEGEAVPPSTRPSGLTQRVERFVNSIYRLPPRVQALVDAEVQRADILGAWIGVGIAAFLGVLYLIAPRGFMGMARIEPVPIAVGLFLLLALVQLRLAYRGPLSRAAQLFFIVADIVQLYALIWSFHLQYGQTAAFSLKAPTFLFVFLLIVTAALRLEPIGVLAAGVTAALGWVGMTLYALDQTPAPALTRDFITYLTSNRVLIGAEVEKVIAILLVTGVLTVAIVRGRRQMVLAATGATAQADLSRFFAPEVAARITTDDHVLRPGFGEIRRGAVLVADIRGFTRLAASLAPTEVMAILIDYQRRMSAVIAAHGGAIDKFLGDGILATFGCARVSDTPAADALRALLALLREAESFAYDTPHGREPLRIGLAVASGEILCGTVGDESRLEFTVIGDAVNLATKLEKLNKDLGTVAVADADTLAAAVAQGFDPVDLGPARRHRGAVIGVEGERDVLAWTAADAPARP